MAALIELRDLSFTYGSRDLPTLQHINLTVSDGEFVLITGKTGCGKSTLLRTFNGLIPHESGGRLCGDVQIAGKNTRHCPIAELSGKVGLLFQNPEDQIFATKVFDEVAFVLENMGVNGEEIAGRVRETLAEVGLADKENSSVHTLSGGKKQRLALAAVLVARPGIIALDEPISQVDPQGAAELLELLVRLNREQGMTVLLVEHRLQEVAPVCQRVVLMDEGRIVWDGPVSQAMAAAGIFREQGLRLPQPVSICHGLGVSPPAMEVGQAIELIRQAFPRLDPGAVTMPASTVGGQEGQPLLSVRDIHFRYDRRGPEVLANVSLTLSPGEIVAVMGANGAGKSTLLQIISGLLSPKQGEVTTPKGRPDATGSYVGQVMQNPDLMLFAPSVEEEIGFGGARQDRVANLIDGLGLGKLAGDFPLALSRGQRLRVAVAAVLACGPAVLLLDEPTTGQDFAHIGTIAAVVRKYAAEGGAVMFCTHDAEFAAGLASRVLLMKQGQMLADGPPREIFANGELLAAASVKPPPATVIGQAVVSRAALSSEEVMAYVRQADLGGR